MTGPGFSDTVQAEVPVARRAALCGAKLRQQRDDGRTTCHHEAGWGTDHAGVGACKVHGGSTPNGRKHAESEQARQLLGTLGVVADPTSLPVPVVHAELQLSAAKQLAAVRWLELRVGDLRPEQVELSPFVPMLRDARRDSDRLLVDLAKLGLDARRVQLEERQVDAIERVIELALTALGHPPEQPEVRAAVAHALVTVEQEETP